MMDNRQVDTIRIVQEYEKMYRENSLSDSMKDISLMVDKEMVRAKNKYGELPEPKIASLEAYEIYCIREKINNDIGGKTIEKVSKDSNNPVSVSLAKLLEKFPKKLLDETFKELFVLLPFEKRADYWKTRERLFDGYDKEYLAVEESRDLLSKRKGFKDRFDYFLINNRIPESDYQFFSTNLDKYIAFCNEQVKEIEVKEEEFYSEFSLPCFVCVGDFMKIKTNDELFEFMARDYPNLSKYKNKIQIVLGTGASTRYITETDSFLVTIRKEINSRHQILDLLHELSHVIFLIEDLGNGKDFLGEGKYEQEKKAMEIILKQLKKFSEKVYKVYLGNLLVDLQGALFELEVYRGSQKDLAKLNAQMFNKCFQGARQMENPFYIFNTNHVFRPLNSLLYAIVGVNTLAQ
jgi:hypothetical protein